MRDCATTLASELLEDELCGLLDLLKQKKMSGNHLEIGTAAGGTLLRMMQCYENRARPHFVVVDPMNYFPNQYEIVKTNLSRSGIDPHDVEFRITKGYDAFMRAEDNKEVYDFIFIDGSHKLKYVMQDLCWARLLRKGGLLCLHDYHVKTKGVILAADRFLRKYKNYTRVDLINRLLVLRKNDKSATPEVSVGDRVYASVVSPFVQLRYSMQKRIERSRTIMRRAVD